MQPVLGKNRAVGSLAGVKAAKQTALCIRCVPTFIESILQGMIEIKPAGEGGGVMRQVVVVAQATLPVSQTRSSCRN